VNPSQIVQMATFFGFQKMELKKIKLMAKGEEIARLLTNQSHQSDLDP